MKEGAILELIMFLSAILATLRCILAFSLVIGAGIYWANIPWVQALLVILVFILSYLLWRITKVLDTTITELWEKDGER